MSQNLNLRRFVFLCGAALFLLGALLYYLLAPPSVRADAETTVQVQSGDTVSEVADALAEAKIIRHPRVLYFFIRFFGGERGIRAGTYRFNEPQNLYTVANRLMSGETGIAHLRITFPEGESTREMAMRAEDIFGLTFSADEYLAVAKPHEGYLFPDTYLFPPDATPPSIVNHMRENFDTRTALITPDILRSGHTLSDIVIMASLIEKEARTTENRRLISGVLWNRLALGMPLQVDAVFGYIKGKPTYSPSLEDLQIDSPYNTYRNQGLPPGPINNPGLNALTAALYPTKTDYLYYLTDKEGVMHYAKTFAEHKLNRLKYLD